MTDPAPELPSPPASSAVGVEWHEAPPLIRAMIERLNRPAEAPVLVGISGPVASGKTTLARLISSCIVATDDYLPDYDRTPEHARDEPASADFLRLARDLELLRSGRPASVPVWSFHTHKREGERMISPERVIVCEGIHALYHAVAHLYDLAIFVEAPRDLRLGRMEDRERSGARGWGVEVARRFFQQVAEPTFARFEHDYRARAHVLVSNERQHPIVTA